MFEELIPQLESELQKASKVQRHLLPMSLPVIAGYELFVSYQTVQALGSDCYDVIMLTEDKVCLACGEVSSVGIASALQMAWLSGCLRATVELLQEVQPAIMALNKHIFRISSEASFTTLILIIIDLTTHQMTLANAGHLPPLIRKADGTIERIPQDGSGPPLGFFQEFVCEVVTRSINPGDMVIVFTDEFVDTMSPIHEIYTVSRLIELAANHYGTVGELGAALIADAQKHANGRPRRDDMTLMVFGRSKV